LTRTAGPSLRRARPAAISVKTRDRFVEWVVTTRVLSILIGFLLLSGCSSNTAPSVSAPSTQFTKLSDDGRVLAGVAFAGTSEIALDVSGLTVDFDCVSGRRFAGTDNASYRISLLRAGCALITSNNVSAGEKIAQDAAKSDRVGRWAPAFWPFVGRWFSQNWDKALAVLSFPLLGWLLKNWIQKRRQRQVHVVLAGHSAAGKTGLWTRWKKLVAPPHNLPPTSGAKVAQIAPFRYGEFTIMPKVIDTAGTEPWLMRDYLYSTPLRAKRVLIVVVAPCPLAATSNGDPVDTEYVAKQAGYMNLPLSVLGGRNYGVRPHLVILFATKFDLLSTTWPGDAVSAQAVKRFEQVFADHRNLLSRQCKRNNIPFRWIIGSANSNWGTVDIRDAIETVVMAK